MTQTMVSISWTGPYEGLDAWRTLPVPTQARSPSGLKSEAGGVGLQVGWVQDWVQTPEAVGVTGFDAGEALPTPTDCVRIDQFSPPFPSGQAETHRDQGGTFQPATHAPLQKDPVGYWYTVPIHSPESALKK